MQHDPQTYLACMEEIKFRDHIIREALGNFLEGKAASCAEVELANLQLRKLYELVTFAAVAANKGSYQKVRRRFERDWNLPEIIKSISRLNPNFLPIAFEDTDGRIIESNELRFTRAKIIKWHSEFHEILHCRNPYSADLGFVEIATNCLVHVNRFKKIMSRHKIHVVPNEIFYLVTMESIDTGAIQVAEFHAVKG